MKNQPSHYFFHSQPPAGGHTTDSRNLSHPSSWWAMKPVLSAVHWLCLWKSWSYPSTHSTGYMYQLKAHENTCLQNLATTSHHTFAESDHSSHWQFLTGLQIAVYFDWFLVWTFAAVACQVNGLLQFKCFSKNSEASQHRWWHISSQERIITMHGLWLTDIKT